MSLPELIPSNLPQFVRLTPRSNFSNSVVPQGSVLLLAESDGQGGARFVKKKPDGTFEVVCGGGGETSFYKCKSVNTTNHTWTGYLASVDPVTGVWSFAETATSGLTFDRITPVVGHVYDADCTIAVKQYKTAIPSDPIFHLPLDVNPGDEDDTGKQLTYYNSTQIAYGQTVNGIPCTRIATGGGINGPDFASLIPNDATAAFTVSVWVSSITGSYKLGAGFLMRDIAGFTSSSEGTGLYQNDSGGWTVACYGERCAFPSSISGAGLTHIVITFASNTINLYINGVFANQGTYGKTNQPFGVKTAWWPHVGTRSGGSDTVYFRAFRIYNRVLDSEEISALAAEPLS